MFHQHVYKIQAISYHRANRKRERIVPLQKMFKRTSPSCRHQHFQKAQKLPPFVSVTDFLNNQDSYDHRTKYPECYDMSEVSFYISKKKEKTYFKNGTEKSYKRVARIGKKMKVKKVAKTSAEQGGSYLRHRSHVANMKNTLPLICELSNRKCIEMDFSDNIAMKPKFEVQDVHFSGKQYSLHCSVVEKGT